jgi:pyruvate/2-oxoglutarate dehydrogenase complex dihydrolipoamide acyltransferase (E2) component
MPIRKQTLEEWFICYQLKKMSKRHFHLPGTLDVDVSKIAEHYISRGQRPPYTAILIKAVALAAVKNPQLNRMIFSTFWGTRVVEFENYTVNLPILIEDAGKTYLSAITIKEANTSSINEIALQIKNAKSKKLSETKVTKFVVGNNNIFKRTVLRLFHFVVFNFPKLYVSNGGGGLSVSSLQNLQDEYLDMRFNPYGPTAMTFGLTTVKKTENNQTIMKIGAGYDHMACRADEMTLAVRDLSKILSSPEMLIQ